MEHRCADSAENAANRIFEGDAVTEEFADCTASINRAKADAPTLKLLVMSADANGAATLQKAGEDMIAALKKVAPPAMAPLIDGLKLASVSSNIQLSMNLMEWAKALAGMK